jgi:hypothetical protein
VTSIFPKWRRGRDNEPESWSVSETHNARWLVPALLAGFAYATVGVVFGFFAGTAASHTLNIFWRWAAWVVSAAVYAGHIGFERFGLRHSTGVTARHVAAAAAFGGLGLAVAAGAHAVFGSSRNLNLSLYALALVAWPVLTGVPAYLAALVVGAALSRLPRRT